MCIVTHLARGTPWIGAARQPSQISLCNTKTCAISSANSEQLGELKRIATPVSPNLEMTEICDRLLRAEGPAMLFEKPSVQSRNDAGASHDAIYRGAGARQSVRHNTQGGHGHGRGLARRPARHRPRALGAQGTRAPRGLREAGKLFTLAKSGCGTWRPSVVSSPACQEMRLGRQRRGPGPPADPDLLARRRGAATIAWGLVVTGPAQEAPEPGHLPPAGHRPQPGDHALAGASRRRAGLPRARAGPSGQALPDCRGAGRGPGHHPRRRDACARHALRVPVRRPAARQPQPRWPAA